MIVARPGAHDSHGTGTLTFGMEQVHLPLAWNSWAVFRERVDPGDRFCHIS